MGLLIGASSVVASGDIALLFTDLTSGPNTGSGTYADGAFVTLYGVGFGASAGSVTLNGTTCTIQSWSQAGSPTGLDMIVVQPNGGTTGNFVVTNSSNAVSNGLAFTVDNTRNIREVDGDTELGTAMSAINTTNASDIVYLRAGTYVNEHGSTGWGSGVIGLGSAWANTAWIAYPGETVTLNGSGTSTGEVRLTDSGGGTNGVTVAKLTIQGDEWCVRCDGNLSTCNNLRVIGNDCTNAATGNIQSGPINPAGDNINILGNYIHDCWDGGTTYNNNHIIYMQESNDGPDDPTTNSTVAYNRIYNISTGAVIQWHTDNANGAWTGNACHSNLIQAGPDGDCRGITIGEMGATSSIDIYNNIIDVNGQDFIGIIYSSSERTDPGPAHTVNIFNNMIIATRTDTPNTASMIGNFFNENTTGIIKNNILYSDANAVSYFDLTNGDVNISQWDIDGNVYYNNGNGPGDDSNAYNGDPILTDHDNATWASRDYSLAANSPVRDRISADALPTTPTYDQSGNTRNQGVRIDAGPLESTPTIGSMQFAGTVDQDYDRVTIPLTGSANIGAADFTIEMWVRPSSTGNDGSGAAWWNGNIIIDRDTISATGGAYGLSLISGVPRLYMEPSGESANTWDATTDIRDDAWHFIVITWDQSTGAVQLYVDDTREINQTAAGGSGDLSYASGGTAKDQLIELGGEKAAQGTPSYVGDISEIRFSSNIRHSGATTTVPTSAMGVDANTLCYWDFSEGSGTSVFDRYTFDSNATVVFNGGSTLPVWSAQSPY